MLKLRVVQPGRDPVLHEFASDEAVIGRAPDCDVVIPEGYVSKRHAKVLAGLVLVDLGSSNGTHVDGQAIREPVLLTSGAFRLGAESGDAVLEVEHAGGLAVAGDLLAARRELDEERRRSASMIRELDVLRRGPASAPPSGPDPKALEVLRAELKSAHARIESLKAEVQERDQAASEGVQVRLAQDSLAEVQARNERLGRELDELRASGAGPGAEAARQALAARVAELEEDRARLKSSVTELERDLETAQAAVRPEGGMSELFFKLQAENQQLRGQLAEAKAGETADPAGASGLFFELQAENAQLRGRIQELEQAGVAAPEPATAGSGSDEELDRLRHENHALQISKADLLSELEDLRRKVADARSVPIPLPEVSSGGAGLDELLRALVEDDVEGHAPMSEGAFAPFVTIELFRFLRQVERLVTRMAGDFIQLYEQRTMLPDVKGNLRRLVGAALDEGDDRQARRELLDYLEELGKWLVVALGANRQAAERFAEELRSDLSERSLTANSPMPALKRLTGGTEAELWRRASDYLKGLTSDVIEERLQQLVRRCADDLRRDQDRG